MTSRLQVYFHIITMPLVQCQHAIEQGCIKPLVDLLDNQDAKLIQLLLDGITNIIKAGDQYSPNPCIGWIEEAGMRLFYDALNW